jgi:hypothetical protein
MVNPEKPNLTYYDFMDTVVELANYHNNLWTWRDKSNLQWILGILEECVELALSLLHLHKHPPEYEVAQIVSCIINFVRHLRKKDASVLHLGTLTDEQYTEFKKTWEKSFGKSTTRKL